MKTTYKFLELDDVRLKSVRISDKILKNVPPKHRQFVGRPSTMLYYALLKYQI